MKKLLAILAVVAIASPAMAGVWDTDDMGMGTVAPPGPFSTTWTSSFGDAATLAVDDNATDNWLASNQAINYGEGSDRAIGVYAGAVGDVRWLKNEVAADSNGEIVVPDFDVYAAFWRTTGSLWGGVHVSVDGASETYACSLHSSDGGPAGVGHASDIVGSLDATNRVSMTDVVFTGLTPGETYQVSFNFRDGITAPPEGGDKKQAGIALDFDPIPEPATMALMGLGGLATLIRRRK